MSFTIAFRCEVGPAIGVGHVMRSIALAEELELRGASIVFVCEAGTVPWVAKQLEGRGFESVEPVQTGEEHVSLLQDLGATGVVFDSYVLPASVYRSVRAAGIPTLAFVDTELRRAEADLLLDQTIGAEFDAPVLAPGTQRLAGLRYALLRNAVLRHRPPAPPTRSARPVPKVLALFGGTDAHGTAPSVMRALISTGMPFDATAITRDDLSPVVRSLPTSDRQGITVIGPTEHLPELMVNADVVLSAAGSSTGELLSLGASVGLFHVAENQVTSYERLVDSGLVAGLGGLDDLRWPPATSVVENMSLLLASADFREQLSAAAWQSVDGLGRVRVADRFLRRCNGAGSTIDDGL